MGRPSSRFGLAAPLLAGLLCAPAAVPAASGATVCVPLLAGTQCVVFLNGRPDKPGMSKGMRMTITPAVLTDTNELVVTISGFRPLEGLRRFNYNIFGPDRMNEYGMDARRADARGRFRWVVAPSTAIYKPEWGQPALCARGQRSMRLACRYFTVAGAPTSDPGASGAQPGAATPAPSTPSGSDGGGSLVPVPG